MNIKAWGKLEVLNEPESSNSVQKPKMNLKAPNEFHSQKRTWMCIKVKNEWMRKLKMSLKALDEHKSFKLA